MPTFEVTVLTTHRGEIRRQWVDAATRSAAIAKALSRKWAREDETITLAHAKPADHTTK